MRKHYDFSRARRNPYARRLKQQVTIRLEHDTISYFKELSSGWSMSPAWLRDCASSRLRLTVRWQPALQHARALSPF